MSGYRFDRLKILVVDDNAHMRRLVVTILNGFGCTQVAEASEGQRALILARDFNPDVMILDWMMEGMSGLEVVKTIRNAPTSPNPYMPIIMLTGHTSAERVQEARDSGINEFLAKPVSVKALLARLTAVIEFPRPFVRTSVYFGPCRRRRNMDEYTGPERREAERAGKRAAS
ncbi:MAG TPA: response regulator [Rhizomicrobium sp.]|nr:response regulator [Rhizomicrobium sp.]